MDKLPNKIMVGNVTYIKKGIPYNMEEEEPKDLDPLDYWVGQERIKDESLIKNIDMEGQAKGMKRVDELTSRFNDALGILNNHNTGLNNMLHKITGESPERIRGIHVDEGKEPQLVEPSMFQKLETMINRLEEVNSDMEDSFGVLKKYF